MIFLKIVSPTGSDYYFVGTSKEDILEDGKHAILGCGGMQSCEELTEEEVRELDIDLIDVGIEAVKYRGALSFMLRTPRPL